MGNSSSKNQLSTEAIQYDSFAATVNILDPEHNTSGMAYWILRHIRGVSVTDEERESFKIFGERLTEHFGDVLRGDFAIQDRYAELSNRIMIRMFEVRSLPKDHPTRVRFDNFDLQWVKDLEEGTAHPGD